MSKIPFDRISLRRGTREMWEHVNPILDEAEVAFEIDSGMIKIGDGRTPYKGLPYQVSGYQGRNTNKQGSGYDFTLGENNVVGEDNKTQHSYAIGEGLVSTNPFQFVIGKYNQPNNDLFTIGCGDENKRTNAFTVDGNGSIYVKGDIHIFHNDETNIDYTMDKYIKQTLEDVNALRFVDDGINAGATHPGTFTPKANSGYMYKILSKGYINGHKVEVGDTLICKVDNTEAATAATYDTISNNWIILQTNMDIMEGASETIDGRAGFVPAPLKGEQGAFLRGDGKYTFPIISDSITLNSNTTYASSNSVFTLKTYTDSEILRITHEHNLNGSIINNPSWYAPTTIGNKSQYLISNGSNTPVWETSIKDLSTEVNQESSSLVTANAVNNQLVIIKDDVKDKYDELNESIANITHKHTLNGNIAKNPSWYAPITIGTKNQYLIGNGNNAPVWETRATSVTTSSNLVTAYAVHNKINEVTNSINKSIANITHKHTLNGNVATNPSWFAPTVSGNNGQYLISCGPNNPPGWRTAVSDLSTGAEESEILVTAGAVATQLSNIKRNISERYDTLNNSITNNTSNINTTMNNLSNRITIIDGNITTINQSISEIETDLNNKVDKDNPVFNNIPTINIGGNKQVFITEDDLNEKISGISTSVRVTDRSSATTGKYYFLLSNQYGSSTSNVDAFPGIYIDKGSPIINFSYGISTKSLTTSSINSVAGMMSNSGNGAYRIVASENYQIYIGSPQVKNPIYIYGNGTTANSYITINNRMTMHNMSLFLSGNKSHITVEGATYLGPVFSDTMTVSSANNNINFNRRVRNTIVVSNISDVSIGADEGIQTSHGGSAYSGDIVHVYETTT